MAVRRVCFFFARMTMKPSLAQVCFLVERLGNRRGFEEGMVSSTFRADRRERVNFWGRHRSRGPSPVARARPSYQVPCHGCLVPASPVGSPRWLPSVAWPLGSRPGSERKGFIARAYAARQLAPHCRSAAMQRHYVARDVGGSKLTHVPGGGTSWSSRFRVGLLALPHAVGDHDSPPSSHPSPALSSPLGHLNPF